MTEFTPEEQAALQREINALIDKGIPFSVKKKGIFKFYQRKKENFDFLITEPTLCCLDKLSSVAVKMGYDANAFQEDTFMASKKLILKAAKLSSYYVAIAILQDRLRILFFGRILAWILYNHIKPSSLKKLVDIIHTISNHMDFTYSIRTMQILMTMTTVPNRIERKIEGNKKDSNQLGAFEGVFAPTTVGRTSISTKE